MIARDLDKAGKGNSSSGGDGGSGSGGVRFFSSPHTSRLAGSRPPA
jgi:hypothetical protein